MASLRRFCQRVRALVRPEAAERDLSRELHAHLLLVEDDFIARGMTRDEARVAARRALGGVDQTKDRHRDARSFTWLEDLRRDVPYAVRGLVRAPGFTVAAVLTLALGIGATTAVFSVVNAVLLQPLPYKDSDRLVNIIEHIPPRNPSGTVFENTGMWRVELQEWRARTRTLSYIGGYLAPPQTFMSTPAGAVRLAGALVSNELLPLLGATATLGRSLAATDDDTSAVVVLSADAWARHFQSDPHVLGRTIALTTQGAGAGILTGQSLEIVGVMAPGFDFPSADTDFWTVLPAGVDPRYARMGVGTIAQLREGVSVEAATDEANVIGNAVRAPRSSPDGAAPALPDGMRRFEIHRVKDRLIDPVRPAFRVLAVAVAVVLLIVVANVANLLLARGSVRQREIGVRLAIGASRGRIVRQVLAESLLLASIGGGLGVALALGSVRLLRSVATPFAPGVFKMAFSSSGLTLPRLHEIQIDMGVLMFAVLVSVATAVLFGIAPAVQLSRLDHLHAMGYRSAGGGSGGALRGETRLRSVLVVGQLVLATALLVVAGLLINSFLKLSDVNPGYDPSRLLTFYLVMPSEYPTAKKAALIEDLLAQLRALPRVKAASFTYGGPMLGIVDYVGTFVPPGRTPDEMRDNPIRPQVRSVTHEFLQTMGVRLVEGRWLDERDNATAPPVMVVNRAMVRQLFDNRSPVGMLVHMDGEMDQAPQQIVGVVEDMRTGRFDQEPVPQMFVDYRQLLTMLAARGWPPARQEVLAFGFQSFVVRTDGDPASLMTSVRALVGRVDPAAGLDLIAPMEDLVSGSMTRQRFYAILLGVFAAIAAVLGAIGIYGVLAYAVLQRTQEIGVRMALGAQRGQVMRLVLSRGVLLTTIGILVGIAGAASLARYLSGMLYGLTPLDPATYVAVAVLFAVVALLASYLPARRATKVDPMVALRCE
jgi:predicted permease